ncbi:MAG: PD40 domain-containing protein [Candidatus Marinimicrobia bacterium]|nr:PD40 domain-containing protein [Candidatus Neomarinimicrobiota bacterium]
MMLTADALGALDGIADDGPAFDYSPDGAMIVYVSESSVNLIASTGGAPTVLTEGSGGYQSPRFLKSSAGELRIIYTLEAPDEEPDGFDVFIMNLDGSDNHEITDVGHNSDLAVSPDRSKVVYTKRSGGYTQIYIFGID